MINTNSLQIFVLKKSKTKIMAKINKFCVVTKPTSHSTIKDILFQKNMKGMQNQFLGGLKGSEIIGTFTTYSEGLKVAKMALLKAGAKVKF